MGYTAKIIFKNVKTIHPPFCVGYTAKITFEPAYMSRDMIFPSIWYVRPAKAHTSLHIRTVWSEPLLISWLFNEYKATEWTTFGVSKLKRRLHMLVWVHTCQNATLLDIMLWLICEKCIYDRCSIISNTLSTETKEFYTSSADPDKILWRRGLIRVFHVCYSYKHFCKFQPWLPFCMRTNRETCS